ncbi:MAG TPA: hypothetical protein VFB22_13440 [Candidatus Baltobacteraceae bacterium]|nr:hypothetical protein [Candidatus Baltobacteraceae bacterium]
MMVVIKQNGTVIRPVNIGKADEDVTEYPEVGYRANKQFSFAITALNLRQPFALIIANVVTDGEMGREEVSWTVSDHD